MVSDFKCSPKEHQEKIAAVKKRSVITQDTFFEGVRSINLGAAEFTKDHEPTGTISLENGLKVANGWLKDTPLYYSKQILVIMGSSASRDPGDIFEVIESLQKSYINTNFLSLTSRVRIASEIA